MPNSLARALVRAALTLAVAVPVTVSGVAVAQAAAPRLALTALAFKHSTVDATGNSVANKLTWTVTNTVPDAWQLSGSVTIRMRSTVTGKLLGHDRVTFYEYGQSCCNPRFESGTPQESTYSYDFGVPSHADAASAVWEVTEVTIGSYPDTVSVSGARLRAFPGYHFTARTLVDATGPTVGTISLGGGLRAAHFYVKDRPAHAIYDFTASDGESGFWKGTIKLAGPGGQKASTDFAWALDASSGGARCGSASGGDMNGTSRACSIEVVLPAGAAAGSWRVAALVLDNNVGGRTTYKNPTAPPITLTSNETVRTSDFAVSPNPVDNWREDVLTELTMSVTGARRGISSVQISFDGGCEQWGSIASGADGRIAVPVRVGRLYPECVLTGIAVVDGAGNLALYGSKFGAPDPGVSITRVPSTAPPAALGASLNPASVAQSELGERAVELTIRTTVGVAPVDGLDLYLYDADDQEVYLATLSAYQADDGTVVGYLYFSWFGLPKGEYTVGFSLSDAAHARTCYDMPDRTYCQPLPGGPLVFTVTEG